MDIKDTPPGVDAWRLAVFLAGLALCVPAGVATGEQAAQPAAVEIHVSPQGDDAQEGSAHRPLATLEAARDAVRRLLPKGAALPGGIAVVVHGGDYVRSKAFELGQADSGTPDRPVVWRAASGQTPRLLGAVPLSGFVPVSDLAVLQRLDAKARGKVLQVDLRARGIDDFGTLRSRGFGRPGVPAHGELFFQGKPMTLARWPNQGQWEHIAGFPETTAGSDGHGGQIGRLREGFHYAGDRPQRWKDVADVWVHGYWAWDWANSYERVEKLDLHRRHIRTAAPHGLYGFRKGQRFYFLNVLEELDEPGEWYLDRSRGMLYFWPPERLEGPASALFSRLEEPLVRISGASHVRVEGWTLEGGRASGIEVRGGSNVQIVRCVLRNLGNWGVRIEGGANHAVAQCDVFDTGDGGVSLAGGDRQTLTPAGHVVEHCHFARQGRWSKCYVPAVLMQGVGLAARNNLIHDHPHCAILFGGNEHAIERNEIHHIALETGDVGAIYTGRDWTFRGNRIRHNYIHHTGGVGMGSMGVYMDDCVSGTEVFGNVFYKVHWAMFIGGGRDHRVENNIFVDCDPAIRIDGRGLDRSPVWHNMVYDYMKKQLAAVPQELYRKRYPAINDLDRYYAGGAGVPPENNVVARNLCRGKWLEVGWHARLEWVRLSKNVVEGVEFADPEHGDFRLKDEGPARRIGFQPIPFAEIGPLRGNGKVRQVLGQQPAERPQQGPVGRAVRQQRDPQLPHPSLINGKKG